MQRLLALTVLGTLGLIVPVRGQTPARPTGFPPVQAEAAYRDGAIVLHTHITQYVSEMRVHIRTAPDGKQIKEEVRVTLPVLAMVAQKIDPEKALVYRADGKTVEGKELAKALERVVMVFVAGDYKKLDPFYLQFLAEDALIVVPPLPAPAAPEKPS